VVSRHIGRSLPRARALSGARYWLREAWRSILHSGLKSTMRQLVGLAVAQKLDLSEDSEAYRTLRVILGDATHESRSTIGKSVWRFRVAAFVPRCSHRRPRAHAELDMQRYVEVLSCVSGGSIVGAQII